MTYKTRLWPMSAFTWMAYALVALSAVGIVTPPHPSQAAFFGPNGKIAFTSTRDGNTEIYVMNADGSGQANISRSPSSGDYSPSWSPDGRQLAFVSTRGGNPDVYIMNADGSGVRRVTN